MAKRPKVSEQLRTFALGLPGAKEEFPWGDRVVKVNKKIFVFLGSQDGSGPGGMTVKLTDSHDQAMSVPGAEPSGYGLGRAGWVTLWFGDETPTVDVLCDWIEESYRNVAPKRLVAELDARP